MCIYTFFSFQIIFSAFYYYCRAAVRLPPSLKMITSRVSAVVYYVYFRLGTETIESCVRGRVITEYCTSQYTDAVRRRTLRVHVRIGNCGNVPRVPRLAINR
jgi:hypothetical protein